MEALACRVEQRNLPLFRGEPTETTGTGAIPRSRLNLMTTPLTLGGRRVVDLTVLLTVFKRDHLAMQLKSLWRQSVVPREIVVYHDCDYRRIPKKRLIHAGISVTENSSNTRFHGRFAYLLNAQTEWVMVWDDDIVPGKYCIESYLQQAEALDGIVGGMGRMARTNPLEKQLIHPPDVGVRENPVLADFVGHMWLFRQELLFQMFSVKPATYETGEDMHLCFSAKLRSGVPSFIGAQPTEDESCDTSMNRLAADELAAFRSTPKSEREKVETYFSSMGLKFITPVEQSRALDGKQLPSPWEFSKI